MAATRADHPDEAAELTVRLSRLRLARLAASVAEAEKTLAAGRTREAGHVRSSLNLLWDDLLDVDPSADPDEFGAVATRLARIEAELGQLGWAPVRLPARRPLADPASALIVPVAKSRLAPGSAAPWPEHVRMSRFVPLGLFAAGPPGHGAWLDPPISAFLAHLRGRDAELKPDLPSPFGRLAVASGGFPALAMPLAWPDDGEDQLEPSEDEPRRSVTTRQWPAGLGQPPWNTRGPWQASHPARSGVAGTTGRPGTGSPEPAGHDRAVQTDPSSAGRSQSVRRRAKLPTATTASPPGGDAASRSEGAVSLEPVARHAAPTVRRPLVVRRPMLSGQAARLAVVRQLGPAAWLGPRLPTTDVGATTGPTLTRGPRGSAPPGPRASDLVGPGSQEPVATDRNARSLPARTSSSPRKPSAAARDSGAGSVLSSEPATGRTGLPGQMLSRAIGSPSESGPSAAPAVRLTLDWVAGADPWQHPEIIEPTREMLAVLEARGVRLDLIRGQEIPAPFYDERQAVDAVDLSVPSATGPVVLEGLALLDRAMVVAQRPGYLRVVASPHLVIARDRASAAEPIAPLTRPGLPGSRLPLPLASPDAEPEARPDVSAEPSASGNRPDYSPVLVEPAGDRRRRPVGSSTEPLSRTIRQPGLSPRIAGEAGPGRVTIEAATRASRPVPLARFLAAPRNLGRTSRQLPVVPTVPRGWRTPSLASDARRAPPWQPTGIAGRRVERVAGPEMAGLPSRGSMSEPSIASTRTGSATVRIALDWIGRADPWQRPAFAEQVREAKQALARQGLRVELVRGREVPAPLYNERLAVRAADLSVAGRTGPVLLAAATFLDGAMVVTQRPGLLRVIVPPAAPEANPTLTGAQPLFASIDAGAAGAATVLPVAPLDREPDEQTDQPSEAAAGPGRTADAPFLANPPPLATPAERVRIVLDWVEGTRPWPKDSPPTLPPVVVASLAQRGVEVEFVPGRARPAALFETGRAQSPGVFSVDGPRGPVPLGDVPWLDGALLLTQRPGELRVVLGPARLSDDAMHPGLSRFVAGGEPTLPTTRSEPPPLAMGFSVAALPTPAEQSLGDLTLRASGPESLPNTATDEGHALARPARPDVPLVPVTTLPAAPRSARAPATAVAGFASRLARRIAAPDVAIQRAIQGIVAPPLGEPAVSDRSPTGSSITSPADGGTDWTKPLDFRSPGPIGAGTGYTAAALLPPVASHAPADDGPGHGKGIPALSPVPEPLRVMIFDVERPVIGSGYSVASSTREPADSSPAGLPASAGGRSSGIGEPVTHVFSSSPGTSRSASLSLTGHSAVAGGPAFSPALPLRVQDVARAEEGRSLSDAPTSASTISTEAADTQQAAAAPPQPNLDTLARQVYSMMKQRLIVERERLGLRQLLRS